MEVGNLVFIPRFQLISHVLNDQGFSVMAESRQDKDYHPDRHRNKLLIFMISLSRMAITVSNMLLLYRIDFWFFFGFPANGLTNPEVFFYCKPYAPQWNLSSKFQLIRINRFGEIKKLTKKDRLTDILLL